MAAGWRPPFHASPVVRKGPNSSKRVSSQDPLLRKWKILGSTASNFAQILAHKPPNLEIFSSQAPKFGNFQFTTPLFQRQISVRKSHHFGNPGPTPLPEKKKVECPPPRVQEWVQGCASRYALGSAGGYFCQNRTLMWLPDLENWTVSISFYTSFSFNNPPISILFSTEKHTILPKLGLFLPNWVLFTIICSNTPNLCRPNLGPFVS